MANGFNFARKPFTNERLPRLVFTSAAIAVLGITLVHGLLLARSLVREGEDLDRRVEARESELSSTNAAIESARATLAQRQSALGDEKTAFLTRLYRRKSFAWTELFNELEEITPAPVRVTAIAPAEDEGRITVTLNVVGRTLADVLEMVRRLEGSSFFTRVFPLNEAILDAQSGETGVAATLELQYVERSARVAEQPVAPGADTPAWESPAEQAPAGEVEGGAQRKAGE